MFVHIMSCTYPELIHAQGHAAERVRYDDLLFEGGREFHCRETQAGRAPGLGARRLGVRPVLQHEERVEVHDQAGVYFWDGRCHHRKLFSFATNTQQGF